MFHAIVKGKVRNNLSSGEEGIYWRKLYRETEDFLTAAFFSRLVYLPTKTVWRILKEAPRRTCINNPTVLPELPGILKTCDFWPRFFLCQDNDAVKTTKEPDCVLEFENITVIIEAKLSDNEFSQYKDQLVTEIVAYCSDSYGSESFSVKPLFLLAVGGIGGKQIASTEQLVNDVSREINARLNHLDKRLVCVGASSWHEIKNTVTYSQNDPRCRESDKFIFKDLLDILHFHGIRTMLDLVAVSNFTNKYPGSYMLALQTLGALRPKDIPHCSRMTIDRAMEYERTIRIDFSVIELLKGWQNG